MSASSLIADMYYPTPPGGLDTAFIPKPSQAPDYYVKSSVYDNYGELPYITGDDYENFARSFSYYGGSDGSWMEVPFGSEYYPKEMLAQYADYKPSLQDPLNFEDPRKPVYMRESDVNKMSLSGPNGPSDPSDPAATGTSTGAPAPAAGLNALPTDPRQYTPATPQMPLPLGSLNEFDLGPRPADPSVRAGLSTAYNYIGDIPSGWGVGAGTSRGTGLANASNLTKPQW